MRGRLSMQDDIVLAESPDGDAKGVQLIVFDLLYI